MPKYVAYDEAGRLAWFVNLAQWLKANGEGHGFTDPEIAELNAAADNATAAAAENKTKQEAAHNAAAAKKTAVNEVIRLGHNAAQRLQCDCQLTNKDRAAAGLAIPYAVVMPSAAGTAEVPQPKLRFEFRGDGEVAVHWGPNPDNERRNARPTGTRGCAVEIAAGGIPPDESLWVRLDMETRSPTIYTPDPTGPIAYAYRARYVLKDLTLGPFTDPIVFPSRE